MVPVVLGLGSNVGDSRAMLQAAIDAMAPAVKVLRVSRVYVTAPMYVEDQPEFLNAAVLGETPLGPFALLAAMKGIEGQIGRREGPRYGPREIDIDLLAYGALALEAKVSGPHPLRVPHPRTPERRFVLAPVADLDPDFMFAGFGAVRTLLGQTESQSSGIRVDHAVLRVPG